MRVSIYGALTVALMFSGCGGGSSSESVQSVSEVRFGEMLFNDTNLSLHRNMSCASCHNPDHGFIDSRFHADANDPTHGALSVGSDALALGGRNAPTAAYAQFIPEFTQNAQGEYIGGQFHDGRALNLKAQAKGPFLDSAEMMMPDMQSVIERIKERSEYATIMKNLYGEAILDDTNVSKTYDKVAQAIAKYEKTEEFAPFDSKYDRFIECKASGKGEGACYEEGDWSIEEQAGYALFFSNNNTNCASCHTLNSTSEASSKELFTNYKFENIGTPRNLQALQARDGNTTKRDRGLGGFLNDATHEGKIKVPTLRNVAVTAPYMSNGVFKELRTVLEFYDHMGVGNRPNNPETSAPWGEADFNATINHTLLKATKELSDSKIKSLEAFLRTLTDRRYEHLLERE
ncbi:MAG: methylamine utilization protein MauG [Epsilonproteobacteria bacterium]|nr:methylamine utilization protein MauG [Campylobacterota bacterium]